jgi:signal transduction histidine kinase
VPPRPDERRILALGALLLALVAAAALVLPYLPPALAATALNAANAAVALAGIVLALRRARRVDVEATGWRAFALAGVFQFVYQAYPVVAWAATGSLPDFPGPTEILQPLMLVTVGAGLLSWSGRRQPGGMRLRTAADGFLFGASLLFVIWAAALHDLVAHGSLGTAAILAVLADFLLITANLGLIVYLAASTGARASGTLTFIGLAMLAGTASYLSIIVLGLRGEYYVGHPADALVLLAVGLFALGAIAPGRVVPADGRQVHHTPAGTVLPYLPVLASFFTVAVLMSRPDTQGDRVLTGLGIAIGLTLLLRQQLALWDVEALSHELSAMVADRTRDLATAQAALARAQRLEAVGRMAGSVARDFDRLIRELEAPIAVLSGAIAADHPDREAVAEIAGASQRAGRLTGQLLTFAQRQPVEPRSLDVNGVIADLVPLLRRLAGKGIALELFTAPEPATVFADPTQIEQLLSNLTVNARDAMPGGGTLSIMVTLHGRAAAPEPGALDAPFVRISVADTGVGMDDATIAHIFEPFYTTKPAGQGTGLGLATCYGIVSRAGGRIRVNTVPGQGTTFTVDLPFAP